MKMNRQDREKKPKCTLREKKNTRKLTTPLKANDRREEVIVRISTIKKKLPALWGLGVGRDRCPHRKTSPS